jgi:hypothetical protein
MTEVVEEVPDHCSEDCIGRWGRNCLLHWIDGGWDRIVNDVDELNRLAEDPRAEIFDHYEETCHVATVLHASGMRYLITDYHGLEIEYERLPPARWHEVSRYKFTRSVSPLSRLTTSS